jgi:hypothetical protein
MIGSFFDAGPPEALERCDVFVGIQGAGGGARYRIAFANGRSTVSIDAFDFEDGLLSRWTAYVRDTDWTSRQLP